MAEPVLHCLGVGPGDPELITLKAQRILARVRRVIVPTAREEAESLALSIARAHLAPDAEAHPCLFPMSDDRGILAAHWRAAADRVAALLGDDGEAAFLTLGDPLLYSTAIHLARALRRHHPRIRVAFVPGVMALGAAAALAGVPLGCGRRPVTIVPAAGDDPEAVRRALRGGGTVVLMKIGRRLPELRALLAAEGALARAVLVARAGLPGERVVHDLAALGDGDMAAGYLAVIIVPAAEEEP